MKRAAVLALYGAVAGLAGCTHVQVLPTINPATYDVSCCVVYAEVPPSTRLSATIKHSDDKGTSVKLGARWKF